MADPFKIKIDTASRSSTPPTRKKKSAPAWQSPWFLGGSGAALVAIAVLLYFVLRTKPALVILPIPDQVVDELSELRFTPQVAHAGIVPGQWAYSLQQAPAGARVDAQSGEFSWTPGEDQGPSEQVVTVAIATTGAEKLSFARQFRLAVNEVHQPPVLEAIGNQTVDAGSVLQLTVAAQDPDTPARKLGYTLARGGPPGARLDPASGEFQWSPTAAAAGKTYRATVTVKEAVVGGLSASQSFEIQVTGTAPPAEPLVAASAVEKPQPPEAVAKVVVPATVEPDSTESAPSRPLPAVSVTGEQPGDDVLLELYKDKKLFVKKEYATLRKVYADRFAQEHADGLRQAFGEDYEEMLAWLNERRDIQEELYLAIDPRHDKVPAALALFKELKEQFPKQIEAYAQLAIATAVTWDNERAVYDYKGHQTRTKSKMPEAMLAAVENFKYLLDGESVMQGRAQLVPWEFLKHMVNHRTPLAERGWALQNYLPQRQMFGKCYKDVPYDTEMLETESAVCKLANQDYTLANLRSYGGVCAMQADFAARVGKSLGVPAEYVGGEGKFGSRHAWVMWVELKQVTKTSIVFSLESFGRYNIDKYYVGTLTDPQTGQKITDRQLELRLQTLGLNPQSARQAELIMQAYPMLREKAELDVAGQLAFLREVIRLSPGNEAAWVALAHMSREDQIEKKHHKAMMTALEGLFTTFAAFPDFTWTVFDDLVAFQTDAKQRNKLYERLVALYEVAGRPDLACEARLKLTELLVADKQTTPAIEGLAYTIKKFPDEGRYVPKMLDQLEAISKGVPDADAKLLQFYQEFLPRIPQMRGSRPSQYCLDMFQRGIDRYKAAGQDQVAQALSAELAKIKAGQGRKG